MTTYSLNFRANAQTFVPESAGPHHPKCKKAYQDLPINEFGEAINIEGGFSKLVDDSHLGEHYVMYAEKYKQYDRDCFVDWGSAKAHTKAFLGPNAGVLFLSGKPVCGAIRIAQDLILTAAHCIAPIPLEFRLFGYPNYPMQTRSTSLNGVGGLDLVDFAVLRIKNAPGSFSLTQADYHRATKDNQAIAVVGISSPIYYIDQSSGDGSLDAGWINYVRYSRVWASKIWSLSEVLPPVEGVEQNRECLFYRTPTFPGMSGSGIIGVRAPKSNGEVPKIFFVGLHLRNGNLRLTRDLSDEEQKKSCGMRPLFNVGVRIPPLDTILNSIAEEAN